MAAFFVPCLTASMAKRLPFYGPGVNATSSAIRRFVDAAFAFKTTFSASIFTSGLNSRAGMLQIRVQAQKKLHKGAE
jgi:hypothetical protein